MAEILSTLWLTIPLRFALSASILGQNAAYVPEFRIPGCTGDQKYTRLSQPQVEPTTPLHRWNIFNLLLRNP